MSNIIVITTAHGEVVVVKAEQITGLAYSRHPVSGNRETVKVLRDLAPALELSAKVTLGEATAAWHCALQGEGQCFWMGDTKHQEKYREAVRSLGVKLEGAE